MSLVGRSGPAAAEMTWDGAIGRARRAMRPGVGTRRRWGRVAGGAAMAVAGAWIFTALYLSAGDRHEVLVVARDVEQHDTVERSDLRVVRVSREPGIETVPAHRIDEMLGRTAGVDLLAGSVLADGQLVGRGANRLAPGDAVVGMVLSAGDGPVDALQPGAQVSVVLRPLPGEDGDLREVRGWVLHWSERDRGERAIDLVTSADDAPMVSAGAADGRATVVVLAE